VEIKMELITGQKEKRQSEKGVVKGEFSSVDFVGG
jgi:hypothetical protein